MMWEPGLAKFTQDHRFVMSLHMMADVLPHLAEVSAALQDLAEHFHLPVDKTLSEWRQKLAQSKTLQLTPEHWHNYDY
ncbi:hypothetical protein MAR_035449 [Mya arenaria]|uniref:Uncharacterized protein n=1 Tax=Mya arenaria TaxID=6604 RepID=A0ABY7EP55_MYAAR|nr:hypothetical protein MAR_035449 [Mya arenaria]